MPCCHVVLSAGLGKVLQLQFKLQPGDANQCKLQPQVRTKKLIDAIIETICPNLYYWQGTNVHELLSENVGKLMPGLWPVRGESDR